jgi:hypothetical protein
MRYVQAAADDGPFMSPVSPGASSGTGLGWLPHEVHRPDAPRPDRALVRGDASDPVYLFDCGRKRRIASGRVMDKYGFDGARVFVVRQPLLDHVACGDEWS